MVSEAVRLSNVLGCFALNFLIRGMTVHQRGEAEFKYLSISTMWSFIGVLLPFSQPWRA